MQAKIIQVAGFASTIAYAVFIVWIYATEPRTLRRWRSALKLQPALTKSIRKSLIPRLISSGE